MSVLPCGTPVSVSRTRYCPRPVIRLKPVLNSHAKSPVRAAAAGGRPNEINAFRLWPFRVACQGHTHSPQTLKGPFLVQRTTNEHLRAKRYMAASLPPALSRAVLWHLVARASSLPSGLPCSSSEAPAQIMRSSPETLSLLSVAHSHSRFSPECLTQSILLLDVMGGLWPLLAVLSVPPASSALQQRAATLLQPSSSDTSAAFVMKNSRLHVAGSKGWCR